MSDEDPRLTKSEAMKWAFENPGSNKLFYMFVIWVPIMALMYIMNMVSGESIIGNVIGMIISGSIAAALIYWRVGTAQDEYLEQIYDAKFGRP